MNEFAFIEPAKCRFLPGIYWGKRLEFKELSAVRVRGYKYTCSPDLAAVRRTCLRAGKRGASIIGFNPGWYDLVEELKNELPMPLTAGLNYGAVRVLHDVAEEVKAKGNDYGKLKFVVSCLESNLARTCTLILAEKVKYLTLAGYDEKILRETAEELLQKTGTAVDLTTDMSNVSGDIVLDELKFSPPDFAEWGFKEALILSAAAECGLSLQGEALSVSKVKKLNSLAEKYGFMHCHI